MVSKEPVSSIFHVVGLFFNVISLCNCSLSPFIMALSSSGRVSRVRSAVSELTKHQKNDASCSHQTYLSTIKQDMQSASGS